MRVIPINITEEGTGMHNLSITPNIPNANLSSINKPDAKVSSQENSNFLQIASESFMKLAPSQTRMVPGSYNEDGINFWKNKSEIEQGLPDLEECIEEKIEDIIVRICSLVSDNHKK